MSDERLLEAGLTAEAEHALGEAERAVTALEGQPGMISRLERARGLVARWDAKVRLCRDRDREQEARRALGPAYALCHCLGEGGSGARVGLSVQGHGLGRVLAHIDGVPQWTRERLCDCPDGQAMREAVQRLREKAVAQLGAAEVARIAGRAEIPGRYRGLTVDTWADAAERNGAGRVELRSILDAVQDWEEEAEIGEHARLLLLAGHQGVGKSGLAAALAQRWVDQERSVLYRKVPRLAAQLRAAPWRAKQEPDALPTELQLLDALSTADLLVLDDLGAEGAAGAGASILNGLIFDILDARMQEVLPTIVTTNLTGDEVMARYGARIYDRLYAPMATVAVEMTTPNLRWGTS